MNNRFAVAFCIAATFSASQALAQFESSNIAAEVITETTADDGSGLQMQNSGGPFFNFYKGLAVSFGSDIPIGKSIASASASQNTQFTQTRIISDASVGSDTDDPDDVFAIATARGASSLTVTFTIGESRSWIFHSGNIGGVHAGGSVSLYPGSEPAPGTEIFYFSSASLDGENGVIGPGTYTFYAEISSFTDANDGFNGLFGGANWFIDFELVPPLPPFCIGDANRDGVVSFPDITTILLFWGNDYSPGSGKGDANDDGVVNFPDITAVLNAWNQVCPK